MKESKNDSTQALSRFGRDKRLRTVTATTERVERRPRPQHDAEHEEQPRGYKRTSFNPNFTRDNRPAFDEQPRRASGNRSAYGDGAHKRNYEDRPAYSDRSYGNKPRGGYRNDRSEFRPAEDRSNRYDRGEHAERGDRYNREDRFNRDEQPRSYGDRPHPQRTYGSKPAHGTYNNKYARPEGEARDFNSDRRFEQRPDHRGPKKPAGKFDKFNKSDRFGKPGRPGGFRKKYADEQPASYPKYNPEKQTGAIRLNRFIAQSGVCSRREADDFIVAGLVSVNGKIVTELGTKVMPTDEVRFNDARVQGEKKVYLVLNKPKGYVTSLEDPHATKTVMELVKGACTERIYPVGRLDKNSLGLLLFTNDGDMTKQLTHPAYQKKKIYQVSLDKPLTRADMDRLAEGITLEDGEIHADEVAYVKENKQEIGIEIHSGRNRIVRRMFEFLGYEVKKLDRVYYAGLTKKNLKRGAWRFLTDEEVRRLKTGQYE